MLGSKWFLDARGVMLVAGRMRRYVGHVEMAARSDTYFVSVHSGRTLEVGSYSEDAVHCSRSEGWEIVIRRIREIVFRVACPRRACVKFASGAEVCLEPVSCCCYSSAPLPRWCPAGGKRTHSENNHGHRRGFRRKKVATTTTNHGNR